MAHNEPHSLDSEDGILDIVVACEHHGTQTIKIYVFEKLFKDNVQGVSKTSQELRMLSPSLVFKGHKVIVNILVLNCLQCNQSLLSQVSGHRISKNLKKF